METSMLFGGEDTAAANGRTSDRHDPVTGEVATRAPAASAEVARRAAQLAGAAFPA